MSMQVKAHTAQGDIPRLISREIINNKTTKKHALVGRTTEGVGALGADTCRCLWNVKHIHTHTHKLFLVQQMKKEERESVW